MIAKCLGRDHFGAVERLVEAPGVDVDDRDGSMSETLERATQRPAGPSVTPEHVVRLIREKVPAEVPGATGGELLERVGGMGPGEPIGMIAPAQEAAWDDADAGAGPQQSQEQVVVLGPSAVA